MGNCNHWFTSDWHLNHKNIIKYCHRPFQTVEEMNHTIIENHINLVKPNDILYILGDLGFFYGPNKEDKEKEIKDILQSFKCRIIYIFGNHDYRLRKMIENYVDEYHDIKDVMIKNLRIILCHYPMLTWNCSNRSSWQLFGHCHGTITGLRRQYDVGVDNNGFKPISFDELKEVMMI